MNSLTSAHPTTTPENLSAEKINDYRTNGFVHIPGILTPAEVEKYRAAVLRLQEQQVKAAVIYRNEPMFTQMVNAWRLDEELKGLTLHPGVTGVARKLAGVRLRLWHDQILIKQAKKSVPTEYHQDQPGWAHQNATQPISAWIALVDVPVERGCMTFIPQSHHFADLQYGTSSTYDAKPLFNACPDLVWYPRVTVPLKAGDCTFHHGRCAHMATPNLTDEARIAYVVMMTDLDTQHSATRETFLSKALGLKKGDPITGDYFPEIPLGARS